MSKAVAGRSLTDELKTARPGQPPAPRDTVPTWTLVLPLGTLLMQSLIFLLMDPSPGSRVDWGVLSFVCLVPWLVFLGRAVRLRTVVSVSYACGVAFYLINTNYLYAITIAGYIALAVYFGMFYGLFGLGVWLLRTRARVPMTISVPVLWVMTEYLRSIGPLALPLLFMSHGLYRHLTLIQVADITGAGGVSFVVAMINGLLADGALRIWPAGGPRSRLLALVAATVVVIASTLVYGVVQLGADSLVDGPRIAVVQGDYPLTVNGPSVRAFEKRDAYYDLMALALQEDPDLVLLPETPWPMILNDEFLGAAEVRNPFDQALKDWSLECDEGLRQISRENDVVLVIGAGSMEFFPHAVYPKYRKYNSAFIYDPEAQSKRRYDKVALVVFGEYTPFRGGRMHWLYRKLDGLNPFSSPDDEFSLTPGEDFAAFDMTGRDGRTYGFGVPICFEDLIPEIGRAFRVGPDGSKRADFLLSISNDGWFNHGSAVPQHLAVCAFRAVENRVGIARSVNTACSGFIDPNGRMHDLVQRDGSILGRQIFDFSVAPIRIDPRITIYSRYGDWFGISCVVLSVVSILMTLVRHRRATT